MVAVAGRRSPPLAEIAWAERRHAVAILGSCIFAALALERLGYRLTTLAIMVFLLGIVERRSLVAVVLVSLLLSLGSFWLFADFLKVPLPRGPWNF
jgi:hypothetical protein